MNVADTLSLIETIDEEIAVIFWANHMSPTPGQVHYLKEIFGPYRLISLDMNLPYADIYRVASACDEVIIETDRAPVVRRYVDAGFQPIVSIWMSCKKNRAEIIRGKYGYRCRGFERITSFQYQTERLEIGAEA